MLRAGKDDAVSIHFVGSIVYIEDGLSQVSHRSPKLVIDGQQRLTTVTLLLAALANALGEDEPVDRFSAEKIKQYYLLNPLEKGELHYKLLLSQTDKESLKSIVSNDDAPEDVSVRVSENFALFKDLIDTNKHDLKAICNGIAKLVIVDIGLDRYKDNPQLIFESMNATGLKLSQADLIRNFILMGLETGQQSRLYTKYWQPMEQDFGQAAYNTHFDSFMRHYLTVKTGEIPRKDGLYEAYKNLARSPKYTEAGVEALVKDVRKYAQHYCAMELGKMDDHDLANTFHDLRELRVDVAYPFLLELYNDYDVTGGLSKEDFIEAVRLVEAYVFRRVICAIPTNSLNKTFLTFTKALKKDRYLESIQGHFLTLPSYRRFPKDDEFKREVQTRDVYNFQRRSYWLRRFAGAQEQGGTLTI